MIFINTLRMIADLSVYFFFAELFVVSAGQPSQLLHMLLLWDSYSSIHEKRQETIYPVAVPSTSCSRKKSPCTSSSNCIHFVLGSERTPRALLGPTIRTLFSKLENLLSSRSLYLSIGKL